MLIKVFAGSRRAGPTNEIRHFLDRAFFPGTVSRTLSPPMRLGKDGGSASLRLDLWIHSANRSRGFPNFSATRSRGGSKLSVLETFTLECLFRSNCDLDPPVRHVRSTPR